jgi:hypothetical protein
MHTGHMQTTRSLAGRSGRKESTVDSITVNISATIGQDSAIRANGSPVFTIRVTSPARALPPMNDGTPQDVPGFGRVISGGPVNGHEILYTLSSVV